MSLPSSPDVAAVTETELKRFMRLIQHHIIVVQVTDNLAMMALINGVWDELNCVMF